VALTPDQTDVPENPTLTGNIVQITETMSGSVISIKPEGGALVKLSLGVREAAALEGNEIAITLPLRHLFYIPQKNSCP